MKRGSDYGEGRFVVTAAISRHHGCLRAIARDLKLDRAALTKRLRHFGLETWPDFYQRQHEETGLARRNRDLSRYAGIHLCPWWGHDAAESRAMLRKIEAGVLAKAEALPPDLRFPAGRRLAAAVMVVHSGLGPEKALRRMDELRARPRTENGRP